MSEAERRKQVQVDLKSLQILRAIIYNQIVQIDPELKEREPAEYREWVHSNNQANSYLTLKFLDNLLPDTCVYYGHTLAEI